MKFSQLNIGQAFEYQGEHFIKATPLVANHAETGSQKLIPRSAVLKVITLENLSHKETNPTALTPNSQEEIEAAINTHQETLFETLAILDTSSGLDKNILKEELQNRIKQACTALKKRLVP